MAEEGHIPIPLEPFGMDTADPRMMNMLELISEGDLPNSPNATNKLNHLIDLVEEIYITSRDNNAILCQMLFSVEERVNKRIDQVKEDLTNDFTNKINEMHTQYQSQISLLREQMALQAQQSNQPQYSSTTFRGNTSNNRLKFQEPGVPPSSSSVSGQSLTPSNTNHSYKATTSVSKIFEELDSMSVGNPPSNNNRPSVVYENVDITPIPGFVIKTRKLLGTKDKVFINIFYHDHIELEPADLPKSQITVDNKPYLVIGTVTHNLDKDGHNCSTYNVGVSSIYFKPQSVDLDLRITSPPFIQKIIHKINLKFNEFLDESSYSLPRLSNGYKGDEIPIFTVPVVVKPKVTPQPTPVATTRNDSISNTNNNGNNHRTESFTGSVNGDNESVISEITMNDSVRGESKGRNSMTNNQSKRRMTRKSIFDTSQMAMNAGTIAGRNLLSGNMLDFIKEESVESKAATQIKEESIENPHVLLGWQISLVSDSGESEIYVITGVRKNYLSKTEYRLSRYFSEDTWVRLKRSDGKSGQEFRPLRKVLFGLSEDEESVA